MPRTMRCNCEHHIYKNMSPLVWINWWIHSLVGFFIIFIMYINFFMPSWYSKVDLFIGWLPKMFFVLLWFKIFLGEIKVMNLFFNIYLWNCLSNNNANLRFRCLVSWDYWICLYYHSFGGLWKYFCVFKKNHRKLLLGL